MSIFGGGTQKPTRLNAIKITQSCLGLPYPTVMGTGKVQQSVLWLNGFSSVPAPQGGKGGGKGSSYIYSTDAIIGLCNGPILGIRDFWSDQSWVGNSTTSESYTCSGSGIYTPQQASAYTTDHGVSVPTDYTQVFSDLNAPASSTLSGQDTPPMTLVPYGSPLNQGQYSVKVSTIGTFALSSVSAPTTVSGQTAAVYSGTGFGAVNSLSGYTFVVTGFSNAGNNGSFTCIANTATTLSLANSASVAELASASAAEFGVTYYFSAADVAAGTKVQISYSYNLPYIFAQENDIVPTGKKITVGEPWWYGKDYGVIYYSSGDVYNPKNGQALTAVATNPPTITGTYHFISSDKNSTGNTYIFAPGDINQEVQITYQYQNMQPYQNDNGSTGIPEELSFTLFNGAQGQSVWSLLTSSFPGQALEYSSTAFVAFNPMNLGSSNQIHNNTYEVQTADMYGGGIIDCNPVQCIWQTLTNSVWGLGSGQQPFPVGIIDNGTLGTWGSQVSGTRQTNSTAWTWCAANGYFISPVMDKQDTAASIIGNWLEAGVLATFMSEGLMKLVPYGDTSVAGNGCTWQAPSVYVVALDDTCFVQKEGEDPVQVSRAPWQDAHNNVQIKWDNRNNQYAPEITPDSDQTSINRYGLRLEDPVDFDFVHTLTAATFCASVRVKRAVNIRNLYKFTLPFIYSYLEPMDIVEISATSTWNTTPGNLNLNIVNQPVRIQKIVDDPVNGLEIEAEDYPYGVGQAVLYNKGIASGTPVGNAYELPGNSEVILFEATNRLTQQAGNQIWIGACGLSNQWGGCQIWVSHDGEAYAQIGEIASPARLGVLANESASTGIALPVGSDPDTVNSIVINMAENSGALDAGSTSDADKNVTLCFVDGELISYSAATITGQDQYTLNGYLRRGQMGSTISSHQQGGLFLRLDDTIFKYTYDPTWAGQTLYFKFLSFNAYKNSVQQLSAVTAVAFTVPGANPGTVDASSGLTLGVFSAGAGPLGWSPVSTA